MSKLTECLSFLFELARKKGFLLYDDIVDVSDAFDLSAINIAEMCESLQSKGITLYEVEPDSFANEQIHSEMPSAGMSLSHQKHYERRYLREDKEHFYQWLLNNNKGSEKECSKYVSNVRKMEEFAEEHLVGYPRFFSAEKSVVFHTYESLMNNEYFQLENKKSKNRYLYALSMYLDYVSNSSDRPVSQTNKNN